MKKGQLKALFIEAKGTGQKYIGVMIQTEGSSEPEVIINPKENFNAKFDYYMAAYDDDFHRAFAPHRDLVYLVDASCDSLRGQYGRTDEQ